jgi:transposase
MSLHLTNDERTRLKAIIAGTRDARVWQRAQALLDLSAGDSPTAVAQRYRVARSSVYNWINRYRSHGVSEAALRDLPRPGRPRRASS